MPKNGENIDFDHSSAFWLILNSINRFSDPQNHRKDILQGLVLEIILSRQIFAKLDLAAILDFRHFEFSKVVNDVKIERIDPENLTMNTIPDAYGDYPRNNRRKTDFHFFY